jgi:hypothetical protein
LKAGAILNITAATNFAAFNFAASVRHIFKQPGPKRLKPIVSKVCAGVIHY